MERSTVSIPGRRPDAVRRASPGRPGEHRLAKRNTQGRAERDQESRAGRPARRRRRSPAGPRPGDRPRGRRVRPARTKPMSSRRHRRAGRRRRRGPAPASGSGRRCGERPSSRGRRRAHVVGHVLLVEDRPAAGDRAAAAPPRPLRQSVGWLAQHLVAQGMVDAACWPDRRRRTARRSPPYPARFSKARIMAVEMLRGPDHMAMRTGLPGRSTHGRRLRARVRPPPRWRRAASL